MIRFIVQAIVTMIGLWLSAKLVPGVDFNSNGSLIAAALILGLINAVVRPVMVVLTFPITVVTLGVRPEHLTRSPSDPTSDGGALTAEVLFAETLGAVTMVHLRHAAAEDTVTVQWAGEIAARSGDSLRLNVAADQAHLFDSAGRAFARL